MTADKAPAVGAVPQGDDLISPPDKYDAETMATWLDNQYRRHGEYDDKVAADLLRSQAALLAERDARIAELAELEAMYVQQGLNYHACMKRAEADEADAARYRWLRMCDWFSGPLCVVRDPKNALTSSKGLGADCPSRERLDAAIDALLRGDG